MKEPKLFQGTILNREQFEANLRRYKRECEPAKRSKRELAPQTAPAPKRSAHQEYRHLLAIDPVAAGEYWRANKEAILSLTRAEFTKLTPAEKSSHCINGGRIN